MHTPWQSAVRLLQLMMLACIALPAALFVFATWLNYRYTNAVADERRPFAGRPSRTFPQGLPNRRADDAEQVAKIRRIVEELGYQAAAPAEARTMLGLKGADQVKF